MQKVLALQRQAKVGEKGGESSEVMAAGIRGKRWGFHNLCLKG